MKEKKDPAAGPVVLIGRKYDEKNCCLSFVTRDTDTIEKHTWKNSVFITGDAVKKIQELKTRKGPDLQVHGSGNLIQTLLKHDLVDELWLKTFPVALGSGKRLFTECTVPAAFELKESRTSPEGVVVASYKRAGEVKVGSF